MNLFYFAYNFLGTGLFLTLFPPFWFYSRVTGRYRESIHQRIGIYPDSLISKISGTPRIWIQAVSVGEINVALSIMESLAALMPDCALILSTTTEHGHAFAQLKIRQSSVRENTTCVFAPVDFIVSARTALSTLKPDILACLETEIWPNWLIEAHRMGIKTALINGRISVRSIKGYIKILPLMKETLKSVDAFSMIRASDAERIKRMGAPGNRIEVNGNAKYDLLLNQVDETDRAKMKRLYKLRGDQPVFMAGSIRSAEEKIIIDVYEKIVQSHPEVILMIAPRHVERSRRIEELVRNKGFSYQFRTDLDKENCSRTASVIIIDTIGELQSTYSIASIVFCGGSLVPLGGQNILEAAVWGKPVFFGPSMEDFLDAKDLLDKTGGGIQVRDGRELAEKALYFFDHPEEAERIGRLAKKAVVLNQGSARKHAMVLQRLLT